MATATAGPVTSDPSIRGGRPHLAKSRVTVADVVLMHLRLGQSLEEVAGTYDLSLVALHAALAYYYDHQAEIDRSIREDAAFEQAFRHDNPSPLQEKLSALREGRLETEPAPASVRVEKVGRVAVAMASLSLPPLTAKEVEETRKEIRQRRIDD